MRAAILQQTGLAPAVGHYPDPANLAGRSLVRVTAAPVVPLDVLCATGTSYFGRPAVPYVPGVQGVGRVEQSEVVPIGSRVWFVTSAGMAPGDGSLAELCSVADHELVPLGSEAAAVDDVHLAALGLSAVAAWMCLSWRAGLRPGERVVVLGGGGAVGQSAIGAALVLGASQVVAVCRSEAAAARARDAGASAVVQHSNETETLASALREACDGPVDVVIDPIFGTAAEAAVQVLGDHGRLVNLGGSAGDAATFSSAALRSRSISILGYTNNALTVSQRVGAITAVAAAAGTGRLKVAHTSLPLDRVGDAWLAAADGRAAPRQVLVPVPVP